VCLDAELYAFFDDLATRWDALQSPQRDEWLTRLLAPHARLFAGAGRILDIGSGTGGLWPHLARFAPQARVIALDLSLVMLRQARARHPAAGAVTWVRANALAMPVRMGWADLVTCHDSFAHFEDHDAALRAFWRALRPGGHLLILHDVPRSRVNEIHGGAALARVQTHLLPPVAELAACVRAAGFAVTATCDDSTHYLLAAQRLLIPGQA
jgi:ubiquinone/menaquinone biosynthesis C-methylase UbiE